MQSKSNDVTKLLLNEEYRETEEEPKPKHGNGNHAERMDGTSISVDFFLVKMSRALGLKSRSFEERSSLVVATYTLISESEEYLSASSSIMQTKSVIESQ